MEFIYIFLIILSFLQFIAFLIGLFTSNTGFSFVTLLLSILLGGAADLIHDDLKNYKCKPHNGEMPTFKDVANGEAHIDTLKATCNDTVEYQLFINWNDSIVSKGDN